MKKLLFAIAVVLSGCIFRPQIENVYPTPAPTPTLAVLTKPLTNADKEAALEFFYHLKVHIVSSEFEHIAEEVRYPITVLVEGQAKTYVYVSEFSEDFHLIFPEERVQMIISTDESDLVFAEEGVMLPGGIVWFDLICLDPECEEAEFLITEINN